MRSERGYTLIEVLITVGMIGVVTAISLPVFMESNARSNLWSGAERVGAAIRQARLKAISTNTSFRVAFDCPAANEVRTLIMTGDVAIDNDAGRCNTTRAGDSGVIELPTGVAYDVGATTSLQVTGRGVFSSNGGAIPSVITVTHGGATRTLTVSGTGQITFTDVH
jgi:prepilin-type N-terminal cleavage/methylation domain-containing protein